MSQVKTRIQNSNVYAFAGESGVQYPEGMNTPGGRRVIVKIKQARVGSPRRTGFENLTDRIPKIPPPVGLRIALSVQGVKVPFRLRVNKGVLGSCGGSKLVDLLFMMGIDHRHAQALKNNTVSFGKSLFVGVSVLLVISRGRQP